MDVRITRSLQARPWIRSIAILPLDIGLAIALGTLLSFPFMYGLIVRGRAYPRSVSVVASGQLRVDAAELERRLSELPGVRWVEVNAAADATAVEVRGKRVPRKRLLEEIRSAGLRVRRVELGYVALSDIFGPAALDWLVLGTQLGFAGVLLVRRKVWLPALREWSKDRRAPWWGRSVAGIALGGVCLVVSHALATLQSWAGLGEVKQGIVEVLRSSEGVRWVLVGLAVAVAPFVEEAFFRAYLLARLAAQPTVFYVLLSASVFAVIHLEASALLPIFGIGIVLALAFSVTRDLLAVGVAHMTQNAVAVWVALSSS